MMYYVQRLLDWLMADPTLGLLLITTALLLLYAAIVQSRWMLFPLVRGVIGVMVIVALLFGLLWAFRAILQTNIYTFASTHGEFSDTNEQSAQSIWGRPHLQRDLVVAHYIEKTEQHVVLNNDPDKPVEYEDVIVREDIPQNSIAAFNGLFDMTLSEREKGYALYNGYILDANLDYTIVNDSDIDTLVDYTFPLSPGQNLYENFTILFDGKDISSDLRYGNDLVTWKGSMKARQKSDLSISYRTRGMGYFYYQIQSQRQIKDFSLQLTVDRLPTSLVNYPDNILSATKIEPTGDGRGSVLTWSLDNAITTAGMGIALPQPEQRGAQITDALNSSPYGLMLMVALISLTVLILGQPLNLVDVVLLAAAYTAQFLIMATASDLNLGFWGSLILGAVVVLLLTYLLFRRYSSRLLRLLVMLLVVFSTVVYPITIQIGTALSIHNFDNLIRIGVVFYLAWLVLYIRRGSAATAVIETAPTTA